MKASKTLQPQSINLVSVILPTYNEAGNIVGLVRAIHTAISQDHEIIVVDDNSPDGTSQLVQEVIDSGDIPGLRLETRTVDRGLTKSIRHGIACAKGDTVVWMDCDFSMPPEKIPALLTKIEEGYDIAVGSRFVRGGQAKKDVGEEESRLAIFLSSMLCIVLRCTLCWGFTDYTSGFIAIRKTVLDRIHLRGDYGEYFIDLMFRAIVLGHSFIELPYVCVPRTEGESKTAPDLKTLLKRGVGYLQTLLKMQGVRLKHWCGGAIDDV